MSQKEKSPGLDRGLPLDAVCGEIDIRIDRTGLWHYQGSPIGRKELVKLFSTVLKKDDNGDYWLETPVEKGRIQVEDAPFIATLMTTEGEGKDQVLRFETNVGDSMVADAEHPIRVEIDPKTEEPSPYSPCAATWEAKIARPVFYDLVDLAVDHDGRFGGLERGCFFP